MFTCSVWLLSLLASGYRITGEQVGIRVATASQIVRPLAATGLLTVFFAGHLDPVTQVHGNSRPY